MLYNHQVLVYHAVRFLPCSLSHSYYIWNAVAKSPQSCPTLRPQRRQPTRLPHPWDSPGKNTGGACHFLLQCMKLRSESEVAQLCLTLSDPMDCCPLGFSVHGIFQARVLEWGAIAFFIYKLWAFFNNYNFMLISDRDCCYSV